MTDIPADGALDSSLAFLAEGYRFVGNRCDRLGSDAFRTRLLGRTFVCARGRDAAEIFYAPGRFTRRGALPVSVLHLLQDEGSVATLDGDAHRHRKALFLSLMAPERLAAMAALASDGFRRHARRHAGRAPVVLHGVFETVLAEAAIAWAGLRLSGTEARSLTAALAAMIENAGRIGPPNWIARARRRRAERFAARAVDETRLGFARPPKDSALAAIAWHRDRRGRLLSSGIAAVELLNILRPTVAIARFATFAALALHEHPETRTRLAGDDAYREAFTNEVRRFYPFFPGVAGIAREAFEWRGHRFRPGDRMLLDLYGTGHDARLWPEPERFQAERFLGWQGDPFTLIPQGGGAFENGHRCAGEWLTIAVMKALVRVLAAEIAYDVPAQDLRVDLSRMPALPESGMRIRIRSVAA